VLKVYIRKVMENSSAMLAQLNADLEREDEDVAETERCEENLSDILLQLQEELKTTKRLRVRDIVKHPEQEDILAQTYDELESDLLHRIDGIQHQLEMNLDRRNTILRVNRAAKTAMDVFQDILQKEKLERNDLELILSKISVYEDHLDIFLKADVDSLLRSGTLAEETENLSDQAGEALSIPIAQPMYHQPDKVFDSNVVSDGDPLEIYTEKDGEVIFKKYSPMGELSDFAEQICESMHKTADFPAAVCDRDGVIAAAGAGRREILERHISAQLEQIMEGRRGYRSEANGRSVPVTDLENSPQAAIAVPILSEGDVLGCVVFLERSDGTRAGEAEMKLATTVAGFLGKQMEN
jgi:stage V sporulation protein T